MAAKKLPTPIVWRLEDRLAVMLSLWGFGNQFISDKTKLSIGQIGYRIKRLGLQTLRHDYRRGTSPFAAAIILHPHLHGAGSRVTNAITQLTHAGRVKPPKTYRQVKAG